MDGRPAWQEDADDGRLARAARRGDLTAYDVLVQRYQRRATAVAYRLLNDLDDAMEVTQDAFLKAYEKLDSLEKPARFGPWLMRIVSNLSLNRRRGRALRQGPSLDRPTDDTQQRPADLLPSGEASPDSQASAGDLKEQIARELSTLPDMQRQALVLFSIEKMPQKEVAAILGCSVQAVKWHVFAARKRLRQRLADYL